MPDARIRPVNAMHIGHPHSTRPVTDEPARRRRGTRLGTLLAIFVLLMLIGALLLSKRGGNLRDCGEEPLLCHEAP